VKDSSLLAVHVFLCIAVHVNNWPGCGLICHRAVKACAEMMGLKDLHCKVEASTKNYQAIVRAFFDALVHQVKKLVHYKTVKHCPGDGKMKILT